MWENCEIKVPWLTTPESPEWMIFNFTSWIGMDKDAVVISMLHHPETHLTNVLGKNKYWPLSCGEWTCWFLIIVKNTWVVVVEEIVAVWSKSLVECLSKLISDLEGSNCIIMIGLEIEQMNVIWVDLSWCWWQTRGISIYIVVGGVIKDSSQKESEGNYVFIHFGYT